MYSIGEKPGKGTYECTSCNRWQVTLDDDDDRLPPCGICGSGQNVKYRKISWLQNSVLEFIVIGITMLHLSYPFWVLAVQKSPQFVAYFVFTISQLWVFSHFIWSNDFANSQFHNRNPWHPKIGIRWFIWLWCMFHKHLFVRQSGILFSLMALWESLRTTKGPRQNIPNHGRSLSGVWHQRDRTRFLSPCGSLQTSGRGGGGTLEQADLDKMTSANSHNDRRGQFQTRSTVVGLCPSSWFGRI